MKCCNASEAMLDTEREGSPTAIGILAGSGRIAVGTSVGLVVVFRAQDRRECGMHQIDVPLIREKSFSTISTPVVQIKFSGTVDTSATTDYRDLARKATRAIGRYVQNAIYPIRIVAIDSINLKATINWFENILQRRQRTQGRTAIRRIRLHSASEADRTATRAGRLR